MLRLAQFGLPFQQFPRARNFRRQRGFFGQCSEIFANKQFAPQAVHRIASQRIVLAGAKNQTHGRMFVGLHPVFAGIVAVKIHLPHVGMDEFANLEINNAGYSPQTPLAGPAKPPAPQTRYFQVPASPHCQSDETRICRSAPDAGKPEQNNRRFLKGIWRHFDHPG